MRIWVGIFFLLLANVLFAQVSGEVESIGLESYYRPECWVPMTVKIAANGATAAEMQIRVIQEDVDGDRVVAIRNITVTPDIAGRSSEPQRFWMYFRPQPGDEGLKDSAIAGGTLKQLQQQLKVVLTDADGKTVANLPITQQSLKRVDVVPGNRFDDITPARFVLCVTDGASLPDWREYTQAEGLSERPMFVAIRPGNLPEDIRGYEMVDYVLWMGATAPDPKRSLEEPRYRALEQWIRQGGMMVVSQGPESSKLRGFEGILPVRLESYRETADLRPLPEMAGLYLSDTPQESTQLWRVAVARAKPGSLVIRTKSWDGEGKETSPFVVRGAVGAGCVTWVAQDLGEPTTVRQMRKGWIRIWDELFGWRNTPTAQSLPDAAVGPFNGAESLADIGRAFEEGGSLTAMASGYVLIAVAFFTVYWVAAGPGLYTYLSLKKLATLNWFLYGVIAVAAAGLAWLVVQAIQSREAKLEHVTLVRSVAGEGSLVQSRIGLYVPSDGVKELKLEATAPRTTNWITPYPEHPIRTRDKSGFLAMKQYELPIEDSTSTEPVAVAMPWRSTLKRVQVRWNGDLPGIEGQVSLTGRRFPEISGALVNGTSWDLTDVLLVYRAHDVTGDGSNSGGDRVIYLPKWDKGERVDLAAVLTGENARRIGRNIQMREDVPGNGKVVYGGIEQIHRGWGNETPIGEGWAAYWYSTSAMRARDFRLAPVDDSRAGYPATLPLASLFDRVPPMRNEKDEKNFKPTRVDVARVGARYLNISPAVAAGQLVVLAHARGGLPAKMLVEGDAPGGDGVILYQHVMPLGRNIAAPATNASSATSAKNAKNASGTKAEK